MGTFTGEVIRVLHGVQNGVNAQPVAHGTFTCAVDYSVNADGTFTQTLDCTQTNFQGFPSVDTLTDTIQLNGGLGVNGAVLVWSHTDPAPITYTLSFFGGAPPATQQRICGISGVAVKKLREGER